MTGLKKVLNDERGATSVLVVLMMIILVTLGSFAMVSSYVNYTFSQNAISWNETYYDMESDGEKFLSEIDLALAKSLSDTSEYIINKGFLLPSYDNVPQELQEYFYNVYTTSQGSAEGVKEIFDCLYLYNANGNITQLLTTYSYESKVVPEKNTTKDLDTYYSKITTEMVIVPEYDPDSHLTVALEILPPEGVEINVDNGVLEYNYVNNEPRYKIIKWEEWQTPIEIDNSTNLWDGQVN